MADLARLRTPATAAAVERALQGQTRPWSEYVFQGLLFTALLVSLGFLLWLLGDIFTRSLPVWMERGVGSFVGSSLSSDPLKAGIAQGLFGSVLLMGIVIVLALPIGVAAAIYLEEYATDNFVTRLLNTTHQHINHFESSLFTDGLSCFRYAVF